MSEITKKYPSLNQRTIEAVFDKLGGIDGAQRFLRGELVVSEPSRQWREEDGIIYFTVISDGKTGSEWITYFEGKGFQLSKHTKSLLHSSEFVPTNGVISEVGVLKGMLFNDSDRITKNIRTQADEWKLIRPNAELACLIRDKFADEHVGSMRVRRIIVMHRTISADGVPRLLEVGSKGRRLDATGSKSIHSWGRDLGFAFVVSQVSSQS